MLDGGSAHAALREADCIVTQGKTVTTTAKDYPAFRTCLRGTTYEKNYDTQCTARIKAGEYFGKRENCMYHSVANYFCTLREAGSAGAAKACYDNHAYYGTCVFYPAPNRPQLAASDFPKFLGCVRGTAFHRDADLRCQKPDVKQKAGGHSSCLKWEFVYAYCNLTQSGKAQREVCYGSYSQFIRSSGNAPGIHTPTVKNGKVTGPRKPGTPYGDGSDYVWAEAPKPNPSRAQKGYTPPKRKVDPRNTYAYYTARDIAAKNAAQQKMMQSYIAQRASSFGATLDNVRKALQLNSEKNRPPTQ